jgi:hypothetical protein
MGNSAPFQCATFRVATQNLHREHATRQSTRGIRDAFPAYSLCALAGLPSSSRHQICRVQAGHRMPLDSRTTRIHTIRAICSREHLGIVRPDWVTGHARTWLCDREPTPAPELVHAQHRSPALRIVNEWCRSAADCDVAVSGLADQEASSTSSGK